MTDAEVAQYLQEHPEFFDAHAEMLGKIRIPDPHDGRVIPIAERQLAQLRERNKILAAKLGELIAFGEENDVISERVHRATLALIAATSLQDVFHTLYYHLREDFSVPHVAIRLWGVSGQDDIDEFAEVSAEIHAFSESLAAPYCAAHAMFDSNTWFPGELPPLQSFAYVKLGNDKLRGLMLLASEEAERFYPEMGTLYLQRLGEITSAALVRHI